MVQTRVSGIVVLAATIVAMAGSAHAAPCGNTSAGFENWKRVFLETGTRGLKTRSDPEERELTLARAKIGELMMRLELAEYLIEKRGLTEEWKRQRR